MSTAGNPGDRRPAAGAVPTSVFRQAFRWQRGRQGIGHDKMPPFTGGWPIPFDSDLLRDPQGSAIPSHADPVAEGWQDWLNLVLKLPHAGGEFMCRTPNFATRRIKSFRPDACEHGVTRVEGGSHVVLSIGRVRGAARRGNAPPPTRR